MTDIEGEDIHRAGLIGRKPEEDDGDPHDVSYLTTGETRTVYDDDDEGRPHIHVKSTSPNPGPRHIYLGRRVCPVHKCWWEEGNGETFSVHVDTLHPNMHGRLSPTEPMYLFEELRPETKLPRKYKTKHVDRDH